MRKLKFKERTKTIIFPVFGRYRVSIIISTDKNRTKNRLVKKLNGAFHETDFEALHIWIGKENASYLLFQENAKVGTIVHECWHCIRKIMDWAGSDYDDEVVAYHLDYLTQEVYDFIHT
jgi:hypothetical protein